MQYVVMRYEIRNIHILHSKNTRQAKMKHFMLNEFSVLTQGQLQIWTEHATLVFENLKPVEKSDLFLASFEHLQKLY